MWKSRRGISQEAEIISFRGLELYKQSNMKCKVAHSSAAFLALTDLVLYAMKQSITNIQNQV